MAQLETKCGKCGAAQFLAPAPMRANGWYGVGCTECGQSYSIHWVDGAVVESRAWVGKKEVERARKREPKEST